MISPTRLQGSRAGPNDGSSALGGGDRCPTYEGPQPTRSPTCRSGWGGCGDDEQDLDKSTWHTTMTPRQMGRRLQKLREAQKLSRHEVAQRAGLSREGVRLIEAGRIDPTLGTLTRLAKALGVTLVELVQ